MRNIKKYLIKHLINLVKIQSIITEKKHRYMKNINNKMVVDLN